MRSGFNRGLLALLAALAPLVHGAAQSPTQGPVHGRDRSRIYRCELNGHITFTDQPCLAVLGSSQSTREEELALPSLNSYQHYVPTPGASPRARSSKQSKQPVSRDQRDKQTASAAAAQMREQQRCQRLADQVSTIHSKMRTGYTGDQGERLRERLRQLEQRRRTERCH